MAAGSFESAPIDTLARAIEETPVSIFSTQGKFEYIPKWLKLVPILAQWVWLAIKYRSITLPSCANPHITSGGMVGDGKIEYFNAMGPKARAVTADYIAVKAEQRFSTKLAAAQMRAVNLDFPVVAKPDLGWCGYGVCWLHSAAELKGYAANYPAGETFLLQRFIPDDGEAGIFYARFPEEDVGRIIGIVLRFYPRVMGNGKDTVQQLVESNIRLHRLIHNDLHKPRHDPAYIPNIGECVRLSLIGSTRVGGLYVDGAEHASPTLIRKMDEIARDMKDFYIGRFDVRYKSLDDLKNGGFTIMEVNGSGSEAVQAWDPKYTVPESYKMVFAKQRLLFELSDQVRKKGYQPIGLYRLAKLHFRQQKLMGRYPLSN